VIGEVFVAEAQTEHALLHEFGGAVLDTPGLMVITEAGGESLEIPSAIFDLRQQQRAAVGADLPAVETSDDLAAAGGLRIETRARYTLSSPSVLAREL